MQPIKLWLDDKRPAPDGWELATTVEQAKEYLLTGRVTDASLDHDLGLIEETGYDLCKWMAERNIWPLHKPSVHSMNPVGRDAMIGIINRYYHAPDHNREV